jgi:hypothetical protein
MAQLRNLPRNCPAGDKNSRSQICSFGSPDRVVVSAIEVAVDGMLVRPQVVKSNGQKGTGGA